MSKVDPTRNYYADLEIKADADADEIRKQFRKLALKYHPDRNPGREQEVVPKFQAIQAASEVLLDPQQRAKYDVDRRKQGFRYNTASYAGTRPAPPPRTNLYTQAPSNFPPPPRRTGPNAARPRSDFTSPRSKFGPESFASFPKPATAQRPNAAESAEQRANNYSAWQKMHQRGKAQAAQEAREQEDAFKPFGAGGFPSAPPRPTHNSNTAKPAMGRSNTTRTPRKSGFDPALPGADEKQAAGTSGYYTHVKPPPRPPPRMQTDASPNSPSDPLHQFSSPGDDAPFSEGRPRLRTPYQSSTGERTAFPPAAGLGRSASTRNSPSRPNTSDQQFFQGAAASPGIPRPHRSASPRSRKPFQETAAEGLSSNRNHLRPQAGNATRPFLNNYDSSDDEFAKNSAGPQDNNNGGAGQNGASGRKASNGHHQGSIFNIPLAEDTFAQKPGNFKSRSTDSINTKFSPEEWNGKFQGAPDYFSPPKSADRPKLSPTRGRSSRRPTPSPQMGNMPPPPPPPPMPQTGAPNSQGPSANPNVQASRPAPVKFSPSQWAQTFKDPSWAYPQPEVSPTKASARPTKTPKSRKDSLKPPKSTTVNDIAEEPELGNTSTDSFGSGDGSAMDIDEDLPQVNGKVSSNGSRSPRRVTVTPDKPEWRDSSNHSVPHPNSANPTTSTPEMGDRRANFRMGSFAHVAPFGPSQEGLSNVADMSANLPFKSTPANDHPQKVFAHNNEIMVPKPPKPPKEPSRISKASWTEYIKQLSIYMTHWDGYNMAMTKHFVERQNEVDTICRAFENPHNNSHMSGLRDAGRFAWLGAVGDTSQGGFGSYLQGLKDDEQVREHWAVACERHRECIQRCSSLRDRVLREAEAGRLLAV